MKDALLNLLVFLLVFVAVAFLFLVSYGISLVLVPGGKGLIFSNPFAGALLPALLVAIVTAQYRSVHRPGHFALTWSLQAVAFFLLLTLSIPLLQDTPAVRSADATPLQPHRFLPLDDGSLLLSSAPPATILIPAQGGLMSVSGLTQFDALNQRFVFSEGEPIALGATGPERQYFSYTASLVTLQTDFLAIYTTLRESWLHNTFFFWFQAASIAWLFMGFYFFFSFRTWPLVQVVLILILMRLGLMFLVYSFWGLPALIDLWLPGTSYEWVRYWGPVILVSAAASSLFFMTLLSRPHRQAALT